MIMTRTANSTGEPTWQ